MTLRKAIWIVVGIGSAVALIGTAAGYPLMVGVGALVALVALPVAWISFLVRCVRWALTGDPNGTLIKSSDSSAPLQERRYRVIGKDIVTGSPRSMSIRAASSREAAATASECGIEVAEVQ